MAHLKYVNRFAEMDTPNSDMYVIDYCVVCSSLLEHVATELYGKLSGNRKEIFNTVEEARAWILEQQKSKGVRVSLMDR